MRYETGALATCCTEGHVRRSRVLVTGANGFVGRHVCTRLSGQGYTVRAMALPGTDVEGVEAAEIVRADLTGPESALRVAARGVRAVVHCAAVLGAVEPAELFEVNHRGTRRLLDVLSAATLDRFVMVSSLSARGPSVGLREPTEEAPLTPYGWSKWLAEQEVRASGLPATILRPPPVYGPGDSQTLPVFQLAQRGFALELGPGFANLTLLYIDDLVDAICAAIEKTCTPGTTLSLGSPAIPSSTVHAAMAQVFERDTAVVRLRTPVARVAGRVCDLVGRWRGEPLPFHSDKLPELLAPDWYVDPTPARELLGWEARTPLTDGIRETARWYRSRGVL